MPANLLENLRARTPSCSTACRFAIVARDEVGTLLAATLKRSETERDMSSREIVHVQTGQVGLFRCLPLLVDASMNNSTRAIPTFFALTNADHTVQQCGNQM